MGGQVGGAPARQGAKERGGPALLEPFVGSRVCVITNDGRVVLGKLRGFDQMANVILQGAVERMVHTDRPVEESPLGLYVIKGDNVAVIGEVDEDRDAELDLALLRGDMIDPVTH